ncbi:hypothetical protein DND90_23685 [Pseudomonas syringae pv. maculicola]|nr:hypothetical protein DND90_23685 [Pseudomonas syringae pv. maculicola]
MNDYKRLGQSTIFKAAFYLPILVGLFLLIVTAFNNPDSSLCLSSECLNTFFNLYKYPISVMGLSIPLTAIAAAIHRSEETSRQISLTQSQFNETLNQNKFSNYIKHKEDFLELIENMENVCKCKFGDPLGIYKKIFPKNNYLDLDFNSHPRLEIDNSNRLLETLDKYYHTLAIVLYDPKSTEEQYVSFIVDVQDVMDTLKLRRPPEGGLDQSDSKIIWPENYADTTYNNIKYIIDGLSSFSSFKSSDRATLKHFWELRREPKSWLAYDKNVNALNRMISEIDTDAALR